jgi:hypothetical protein
MPRYFISCKQATNFTESTLVPGVCKSILCRRGHHLHIDLALKLWRLLISETSATKQDSIPASLINKTGNVLVKLNVVKRVSLQIWCVQDSHLTVQERYFISRPISCVFLRPLQMLLPSATGWTTGVSSFLQPAGTQRYQCGLAHWHELYLKTACLTSQKPNMAT